MFSLSLIYKFYLVQKTTKILKLKFLSFRTQINLIIYYILHYLSHTLFFAESQFTSLPLTSNFQPQNLLNKPF